MIDLWASTTNKGKFKEFNLILDSFLASQTINLATQIQLHSLDEIPSYYQPPENGKTFDDNARIKAKSLKVMKSGQWVFAEDSGLEVIGLGGLPGIHSARYAGDRASDSENNAKLLKMLTIKNVSDRSAKFVCTIIAYDPSGVEHIFKGEMSGSIAKAPKGQHGFGYDPVFTPNEQTLTLAELGPGFKIKSSHRTQAFKQLIEKIIGK